MTRTILDIHILQTVPPSNINRDDTGSPKTAVYGGVRRARVSSQAWKRATRKAFDDLVDPADLGVRTKKVAEALAERITAREPALDTAAALGLAAETLRTATGSKIDPPKRKAKEGEPEPAPESSYLMFLGARQLDALAELAVKGSEGKGDVAVLKDFFKDKENKALAKRLVDTRHSVDIALFGRMVADGPDLNVEAATQVAHALSVHAVDNESDYYTAVDDRNSDAEPGAGMIGVVDFNSATLYRYAALDVDRLHANLGAGLREDEHAAAPTRRAVEAFLEGFITSLPTGKVNTFGNHTLPCVVLVKLRSKRPISFVAAFERAVAPQRREDGFVTEACRRLARHVPELEAAYGVADGDGTGTWLVRVGEETEPLAALGESLSIPELVTAVGETVAGRLISAAEAGSDAREPIA
ncbi:type I-E CRISPR-associated protein Cas7/Cse4/CasC [Actinacidiphila sp. DG2A-62]|uniref:type I-E CRISPR-associated protein Cas7/Cse4/CasC n=1 Tax=Actinacidiphila sp. DG2A-62 TaxID=3108821 RepID=UPI002DB599D7|nr:type I-E CRISPR-associated protein Cas7/Cse4/CasC [Actinacidiphila sp. DG2A-62]MEC3995561.1 type I-E CRISPR-associated protein Cas7/Cse4/CasC [Actinacidiphila sp. DG2A-62]